ncbi:hypothetical protein [Persicobacter diffluens]
MKLRNIFFSAAAMLAIASCQEKVEVDFGPMPEPSFTMEKVDANTVRLTNTSKGGFLYNWDFGNTEFRTSDDASETFTVFYDFKDDYEIKLTASAKAGAVTTSQTVSIDETIPEICEDEVRRMLSGGCDGPGQKIWVWRNEVSGHIGVGGDEVDPPYPDWWANDPNMEDDLVYDDEFVFTIRGEYIHDNKGDSKCNWYAANENLVGDPRTPTFTGGLGQYQDPILPFDTSAPTKYTIEHKEGERFPTVTFSADNFIGLYNATSTYYIVELTETTMMVRHRYTEVWDGQESGGWRYLQFKVKE